MARKKSTPPASPAITTRVTYAAKVVDPKPVRGAQPAELYARCVVGYTTPEGERRTIEADCAPDLVEETKADLKARALELATS